MGQNSQIADRKEVANEKTQNLGCFCEGLKSRQRARFSAVISREEREKKKRGLTLCTIVASSTTA